MGTRVPDSSENFKMCMCSNCPTFKSSPLKGALYCARGKAEQVVLHAGCMCGYCPVGDKYDLKLEYYCVRGKSGDLPP